MCWRSLREGSTEPGSIAFHALSNVIRQTLPIDHPIYTVDRVYDSDGYLESLSGSYYGDPHWASEGLREAVIAVVNAFVTRSQHDDVKPSAMAASFIAAQLLRGKKGIREEGRLPALPRVMKAFESYSQRTASVVDFELKDDRSGIEG